jgi:hypothetical protein
LSTPYPHETRPDPSIPVGTSPEHSKGHETKSFFFTTLTAGALASVAARTDSGVPGACSDVITTVTNKTVYVDVTSTQRNSPRETNPANCASSLTAKEGVAPARSNPFCI